MTRNAADDLCKMAERLRPGVGGRGRRSSAYRWLDARADAFEALLDKIQPSWRSVAEALGALDLRDGSGKHPTGDRARKIWAEVKSDRSRPPKALPRPGLGPGPTVVLPPAPPSRSAQELRPAPVRPAIPVVRAPEVDDDPLASIRREMNQRSGRKP